jgi:hypothetical protein
MAPAPVTTAVYAPGSRVMSRAVSKLLAPKAKTPT